MKVDANAHQDVNDAIKLAVGIWKNEGKVQAFVAAKAAAYAEALRAILNDEVENPAQLAWNVLFLETNLQAAEAHVESSSGEPSPTTS